MTLKSYEIYQSKSGYGKQITITFINEYDDEIIVSWMDNGWAITCNNASITDVRTVIDMIESGKLEVEL